MPQQLQHSSSYSSCTMRPIAITNAAHADKERKDVHVRHADARRSQLRYHPQHVCTSAIRVTSNRNWLGATYTTLADAQTLPHTAAVNV
jgi:hypothetical protein